MHFLHIPFFDKPELHGKIPGGVWKIKFIIIFVSA